MSVTKLTNTDREYLLSHSAKYMPDNPTLEGWSGERVRETFWYPVKIEFDWIQRLADETYALEAGLGGGTVVPAHATKADQDGDGNVIKDTYAKLAASQTFSGDNTFSGTVTLSSIAGTKTVTGSTTFQGANAYFGFLNGGASNNNHELHVYYTTYLHGTTYSADIIPANTYTFGNSDKHWGAAHINNLYVYTAIKNGSYSLTLPSASGVLATEGYADAAEAAAKAYADAEVGKLVSGDYTAKKAKQDDMGNRIYSTYIQFAHVVNALTSDATNFPLSAAQGKVLKGYIDAINALLASNDEDLDTIQEIVAYVKNNKDLIDSITSSKVSVSDIVDAVTSQATNKPLSANQGYVLKGLIDALSSSKVAVLDIIDNLTSSTESAKPLSAKQGYVLKGLIDGLEASLNLSLVNVTSIANAYSSSSTYSKGDFAVHSLALYRAKQDISTAEEWTSSHWEQVNIVNLIKGKLDKGDYDGSTGVGYADFAKAIETEREIEDADEACPPITFGVIGDEAEVQTGYSKFEELRGNTFKWSQLFNNPTPKSSSGGLTITYDSTTKVSTINGTSAYVIFDLYSNCYEIVKDHYYLALIDVTDFPEGAYVVLSDGSTDNAKLPRISNGMALFQAKKNADNYDVMIYNPTVGKTFTNAKVKVKALVDLGTETYTLTSPRVLWSMQYAALHPEFNAGELISAQSSEMFTQEINQWNEEWETGTFDFSTGAKISDGTRIRSKNPILLDSTKNYFIKQPTNNGQYVWFYDANGSFIRYKWVGKNNPFSVPSNAKYMTFASPDGYGTTYNRDISININFDYDPNNPNAIPTDPVIIAYHKYAKHTVALPNIPLRSIGSVHDVLYRAGGGKRRIGVADLSQLGFTYDSERGFFGSDALKDLMVSDHTITDTNIVLICDKYKKSNVIASTSDDEYAAQAEDKTITYHKRYASSNCWLYIKDSSLNGNPSLITGFVFYVIAEEQDITTTENPGWPEPIFTHNYGTIGFDSEVPQAYFVKYLVSLSELLDTLCAHCQGNANDVALNGALASGDPATLKALKTYVDGLHAIEQANAGGALRHQLAAQANVDFNNTAYVDLGDVSDWYFDSGNQRFIGTVSNLKLANQRTGKMICPICKTIDDGATFDSSWNMVVYNGNKAASVIVHNHSYTDATAFKAAMKGILLAYEKASS